MYRSKKKKIRSLSSISGYTPGKVYTGYEDEERSAQQLRRKLNDEIEELHREYAAKAKKEQEEIERNKEIERKKKKEDKGGSRLATTTPSKNATPNKTNTQEERESLFSRGVLNNGKLEPLSTYQPKPVWESSVEPFIKPDAVYSTQLMPTIPYAIDVQNKQEKANAILQQARLMASQFDPLIDEARKKVERANQKYLELASNVSILSGSPATGYYDVNGSNIAIRFAYDNYLKAQKQLDDLQQTKQEYINTVVQQSDPNERYSAIAGEWVLAQQLYQDAKSEYDQAKTEAFANMNAKTADRFIKAKERLNKIDYMSRDLGNWMRVHGRLPNSIDELPSRLLNFAKKVFYDGKVLNDDTFKSTFDNIAKISKEDITNIGNRVFQTMSSGEQMSANDIRRFKDEQKLLEDAYRSIESEEYSKNTSGTKDVLYGLSEIQGKNMRGLNIFNLENNRHMSMAGADNADAYFTAAQNRRDREMAVSLLDKALHHKDIDDAVKRAEIKYGNNAKSGMYNIARSVYDYFTDADTYFRNTKELGQKGRLNKIADKMMRGDELNSSEYDLVRAHGIENIAHGQWGAYEEKAGYRAGKVFAESLAFMAEFIATNGALRGIQGTAKNLTTKALLQSAKNKASIAAAENFVEKYGVRAAKKQLIKEGIKAGLKFGENGVEFIPNSLGSKVAYGMSRVAADALYAFGLENTLQLGRIARDAEQLKLGNVDTYVDNEGNVQVRGFNDRRNSADSWILAEKRGFVENFSEMMGEFGIGTFFGKQLAKIPGVSAIALKISNSSRKLTTKLAKRGIGKTPLNAVRAGQYHGFFGEVSEEYYAVVMNHLLGSQDDPNKDLFSDITDKQQFLDIVGGIALSSGFLGAISTGHYFVHHKKFLNAKANLAKQFGDDVAKKLERSIMFADERDVAIVMNNMLSGISDKDKKEALVRYYDTLMRYRGAAIGEERLKNKLLYKHDKNILLAQEAGYHTATLKDKKQLDKAVDMLKSLAAESIGVPVDQLDTTIDKNGGVSQIVLDKLESGEWTKEDANALLSYDNARNVSEGMSIRLSDDMYDRADFHKLNTLRRSNANGLIQVAKDKNDKTVFIVTGNVVTKPGTKDIDVENSEDKLITIIDENNVRKIIDISDLKSIEFTTDAKVLSEYAYVHALKQQFDLNKQLENFQLQLGSKIRLTSGKIMTVIGSTVHGGVVYAISDEDGSNSLIFNEENPKNFLQIVKDADERTARNITEHYLGMGKSFDFGYNQEEQEPVEAPAESITINEYPINFDIDYSGPGSDTQRWTNWLNNEEEQVDETIEQPEGGLTVDMTIPGPKKRGRKKGSKNKPKTPIVSKTVVNSAEKQASSTKLQNKLDSDLSSLNKAVSSYHYFLTVNGQRKMYRRVHSVIGDKYPQTHDSQKYYDKYVLYLKDAYNSAESLDAFKKAIDDLVEDRLRRFDHLTKDEILGTLQVDEYIDQLKNDPQQLDEVIYGIANCLSREAVFSSVDVGSVIDVFGREFFINNGNVSLDQLKVTLHGVEHEMSEFISEELFKDLMYLFSQLKNTYDALKWTVITEPCILYGSYIDSTTNSIVNIAGETDAIAIDEDGNYHILDFKTYNWGKRKQYPRKRTSSTGVSSVVDDFIDLRQDEDSFEVENEDGSSYIRKPLRSDYTQYQYQLSMYAMMAENSLGNVSTIECIMIGMEYNKKFASLNDIKAVHLLVPSVDDDTLIPNRRELLFDRGYIDRFTPYDSAQTELIKHDLNEAVQQLSDISIDIDPHIEFASAMPHQLRDDIDKFYSERDTLVDNVKQNVFTTASDMLNAINQAQLLISESQRLIENLDDIVRQLLEEEKQLLEYERQLEQELMLKLTEEDVFLQSLSQDELFVQKLIEDFNLTYDELKQFITDNFFRDDLHKYDVSEITDELTLNLTELLTRLSTVVNNLDYLSAYVEISDEQQLIFGQYIRTRNWCVNNIFRPNHVDATVIDAHTEDTDYLNEWYHMTTTYKNDHVTGAGDISTGIENSTAPDGSKLLDVTGNSDFIVNSIFELILKPGKDNKRYPYVLITYDGKTYSPIAINTAREYDNHGNIIKDSEISKRGWLFSDLIRTLYHRSKLDEIIIPSIMPTRTNGRIKEGKNETLIKKGLVTTDRSKDGINIYDVEYSSNQSTFCITTSSIVAGTKQVVAQIPNTQGLRGRNTVFTYGPNNKTNPSVGTIVMMVQRQYDEIPASMSKPVVPVNLLSREFTDGDAQLVVDILSGKYSSGNLGEASLDEEFVENGVHKVLSNRDVLNMLISYGKVGQKGKKEHVHIQFDKQNPNIVYLRGNLPGYQPPVTSNGEVLVTNIQIDLRTQAQLLKDILTGKNTENVPDSKPIKVNISEDFMGQRFALASTGSVMHKLTEAINAKKIDLSGNNKLTFGKSGIVFELADFKENAGDTRGLSGLGWYIKNGFLTTICDGFENTLIRFNDQVSSPVKLVNKAQLEAYIAQNKEAAKLTETQTEEESESILAESVQAIESDDYQFDDYDSWIGSEDKVQSPLEEGDIQKDEALRHIKDILGDDVEIEWFDDFIELLNHDAAVVGRCYVDTIQLSGKAKSGVEYHEAFHRILELLIPEKRRQKIYQAYRNANSSRANLTDKQISEALADEFMYFMLNKPTIKLTWNIKESFNSIKQWVSFFRKIGSFGLYRLYSQAKRGKFKNKKVIKSQADRFNELYKDGMNFTVRGVQFDHLLNEHDYKVFRESLIFALLDSGTQAVDWSGINVQSIKTDLDTILKSNYLYKVLRSPNVDEDTKKAIVELVGIATDKNGVAQYETTEHTETRKNKSTGKEETVTVKKFSTFKKGNDNWEAIVPDILSKMSQFVSDYKIKFEEEKNAANNNTALKAKKSTIDNDITTSEEDTANSGAEAIEGHVKRSAEFKPIERASARVKFFFSGIPMSRFTTTLNKDGQEERKLSYLPNERGLLQYYDHQEVFSLVLNQLHEVSGIHEFKSELERLAKESAIFSRINDRFQKRWSNAFEIIDGKEVIKNEDECSLIVEIVKSIRNAKNEYLVPVSSNSPDGRTIDVKSTDREYNSRQFRQDWSDIFSSGCGYYIGIDSDGHYTMKANMSPLALQVAAARLGNMYDKVKGIVYHGIAYAFSEEGIRDPKYTITIKLKVRNAEGNVETIAKTVIADINNDSHLLIIKENLITALNMFGIQINIDEFDYMLLTRYGSTGTEAMTKFVRDADLINAFAKVIANMCSNDGHGKYSLIIPANMKKIWNNLDLTRTLATGKYEYLRSTTLLSVMTVGNNKYYVVSEDNLLTQNLRDLSKDPEFLANMLSDPYNAYKIEQEVGEKEKILGSRIFMEMNKTKDRPNLRFVTLSGLKTDEKGSDGVPYDELSERDDCVAKLAMLADNILITPPLSDKTSYGGIQGMPAFGLDYGKHKSLREQADKIPVVKRYTNAPASYIQFPTEILDLFIAYATCERNSILSELDIELDDTQKVDNFHKGQAVHIRYSEDGKAMFVSESEYKNMSKEEQNKCETRYVRQGARFSSLLGVHYMDPKTNLMKFYDFNKLVDDREGHEGEYMDERQNLIYADAMFFNQPIDVLRQLIAQELTYSVGEALEYLKTIGLVTENEGSDILLRYNDNGLDTVKIKNIARVMFNLDSNATPTEEQMSTALISYVADMEIKCIMSAQECERLYSGNPAYAAWKYDESGHLSNRTSDEFKRNGGLASTGQNNCLDIPGMSREYTCAQVEDEIIVSEFTDLFEKLSIEGELRSTLIRQRYEEGKLTFADIVDDSIKKEVDKLSIEDVKKELGSVAVSVIENTVKSKTKNFRKVKVADGAAYVTDDMCEAMLKQIGLYSESVKRAFRILRGEELKSDGTPYTTKDVREVATAYNKILTTLIGVLKYTAYGFRPTEMPDGTIRMLPYYNKMALFPIFKCMATGSMYKLYQKMKDPNNKVDMLLVNSAVKLGGKGAVPLSKKEFDSWNDPESGKVNFDNFKFNTYKQSFKYLRKLFNTDPKETTFMSMGTQMTKVALSVLLAGEKYQIDDQELFANELLEHIMTHIKAISKIGYDKLRNKFFNKDGSLDVDKFSSELTYQLSQRDANRNVLDAVSTVLFTAIDPATGKEITKSKLKLPLAAQSGTNWILSVIASIIDEDVIDINTPGLAFYQRSIWGMEGRSVIDDDNMPPSLNDGNKLQMINEEGSMDCVLSIDFFDYLWKDMPQLKNQSFEAKRNWLIRNGIISGRIRDPKAKDDGVFYQATSNMVGYRIPTQAASSIHALRCVDVIPAVRHTVILPAEFTAITGSDFDIDKLFISTLNYRREEIEPSAADYLFEADPLTGTGEPAVRKTRQKHRLTTKFKKGSLQYHQNQLIKGYIAMLKQTKYAMALLHGPIDSDTQLLEEIRDDLREGKSKRRLGSYNAYTIKTNVQTRHSFSTGKTGIAPYALNNNNHILTVLYGVRFKYDRENILTLLSYDGYDTNSLAHYYDRYGKSIFSWLSGLINAHVDVSKDPYIPELGVDSYTYNTVSLLIRTGFGQDTFYFTTLPIIREFATAYSNGSGIYMQDTTVSKYTRQRRAVDKIFIDYINENLGTLFSTSNSDLKKSKKDAVEYFKHYFKLKYGCDVKYAIRSLMSKDGCAQLRQISKQGLNKNSNFSFEMQPFKDSHFAISMFDVQALVALTKFELEPSEQALSSLVQQTKIDTKKQGRTIGELNAYGRNYNKLLDPRKTKFEYRSLRRLVDSTYIDQKTNNALSLFKEILQNQLIQGSDLFDYQIQLLSQMLGTERDDLSFYEKLTKIILAKIKSGYFFGVNGYCKRHNIDAKSLVTGDNTIYDRLNRLKTLILLEPKYENMRTKNLTMINYLLRTLVPDESYNNMSVSGTNNSMVQDDYPTSKFVKSQNQFEEDALKDDEFVQAWEDLLNDSEHPELLKFAQDLIVYAFMTSGDNGGKFDLFKYVPVTWKVGECDIDVDGGETYEQYMDDVLKQYQNGSFAFNSYDYRDMILNSWYDDEIIPTVYGRDRVSIFSGTGNLPLLLGGINAQGDLTFDQFPEFFKMKRNGVKQGQRSVNIYKFVALGRRLVTTNEVNGPSKRFVTYPIYELVQAKGTKQIGGQTILAMNRNDSVESEKLKSFNYSIPSSWAEELSKHGYVVNDTYSLLNALAHAISIGTYQIQAWRNVVNDSKDTNTITQFNTLFKMVEDYSMFYRTNNLSIPDARSIDFLIADSEHARQHMIEQLNTPLDLETKDDRYTPIDIDVNSDTIKNPLVQRSIALTQSGYNVEYYHKQSKDGDISNLVVAISLRGHNDMGFFEIVEDVDLETKKPNGEYSLHFKTVSAKAKNISEFASTPLTNAGKISLFKAVLYCIPDKGKISTHGELSKGGEHAMNMLDLYTDANTGGLIKIGTRELKMKESDDKVEIPVWQKDTQAAAVGTISHANTRQIPTTRRDYEYTKPGDKLHLTQKDLEHVREIVYYKDGQAPEGAPEGMNAKELLVCLGTILKLCNMFTDDISREKEVFMPYSQWKQLPKGFRHTVQQYWNDWDGDGYERYDLSNKTIRMTAIELELFTEMLRNPKLIDFVSLFEYDTIVDKLSQTLGSSDKVDYDEFVENKITPYLRYEYIDDRQLEFDFSGSQNATSGEMYSLSYDSKKSDYIRKIREYYINNQAIRDHIEDIHQALLQEKRKYSQKIYEDHYDADDSELNKIDNATKDFNRFMSKYGMFLDKKHSYIHRLGTGALKLLLAVKTPDQILDAYIKLHISNLSTDDMISELLRIEQEGAGSDMYYINPKKVDMLKQQVYKKLGDDPFSAHVEEAFDFLEKLDDNPENRVYVECCLRWLKNGSVVLPRDNDKLSEVFDFARKHHIDVQNAKSPFDLYSKWIEANRKTLKWVDVTTPIEQRSEFTFNHSEEVHGQRVDIFDVENTQLGLLAMAQFLHDCAPIDDTGHHIKYSPWCIFQYNVDKETDKVSMTPSAIRCWNRYNRGKRQVAVVNGRPIAFNSSSRAIDEWWDFDDHSHRSLSSVDASKSQKVYNNRLYNGELLKIQFGRIVKSYKDTELMYVKVESKDKKAFSRIAYDTLSIDTSYNLENIYEVEVSFYKPGNFKSLYINEVYSVYVENSQGVQIKSNMYPTFLRRFIDLDNTPTEYEVEIPLSLMFDRIHAKKSIKVLLDKDILSEIKQTSELISKRLDEDKDKDIVYPEPYIPLHNSLAEAFDKLIDGIWKQIENTTFDLSIFENKKEKNYGHKKKDYRQLSNTAHAALDYVVENELNTAINNLDRLFGVDRYNMTPEIEQIVTDTVKNTELLKKYHELIQKPANAELSSILRKILRDFNFEIIEGPLNDIFGNGVLGKFDYLLKLIYLQTHDNLNAIVEPEEFSHAFIRMMGAVYHLEQNRERYPETREYSELRDMIETTDFYYEVYQQYKDRYKFENGNPNDSLNRNPNVVAIKEEAMGKALAVVLNERFSKYAKDKIDRDSGFFGKLKVWFRHALDRIATLFLRATHKDDAVWNLLDRLNKIADSILKGDYYEKYLKKINSGNFVLQDFDRTIELSIARDGGFAVGIMQNLTDLNGIITGSIATRAQGTIFRPTVDSLHDIDCVFPASVHGLAESHPNLFNYYHMQLNQSREDAQAEIMLALSENEFTSNMLSRFEEMYPDSRLLYAFFSDEVIILNVAICEDQSLIDEFLEISGNFNHRVEVLLDRHKDINIHDKLYFIDMFFNKGNASSKNTLERSVGDRLIKLTDYTVPFKYKMKFGRAKDLYDYQHYAPFHRHIDERLTRQAMYHVSEQYTDILQKLKTLGSDRMEKCGG